MRGIGVDIAAAIGAKHFDRDLRSHRALHDSLRVDDLFLHDRLAVGAVHRLALVVHLWHLDVNGSVSVAVSTA